MRENLRREKNNRTREIARIYDGFNRCPPERSRSLAWRVCRLVWNVSDWRDDDSACALHHVAGRPLAHTPTHPTRMRHPLKLPGFSVRAQRTGWGNGSSVWEICIYIFIFSFSPFSFARFLSHSPAHPHTRTHVHTHSSTSLTFSLSLALCSLSFPRPAPLLQAVDDTASVRTICIRPDEKSPWVYSWQRC